MIRFAPVLLVACVPQPLPACGGAAEILFEDGFEGVPSPDDLASAGWTQAWGQNGGSFRMSHEVVASGQTAMHFEGPAGNRRLVKSLAETKGLCISGGDRVVLSAAMLVPGEGSLSEVFLADLECGACGSGNPGPRVQLKEDAGYPRLDRGKLREPSLGLAEVSVPRGRWFTLALDLTVGDDQTGRTVIAIDGQTQIDVAGRNAPWQMRLDNFQVGLTASASPAPVELFVDDVRLERLAVGP